MQYITALHTHIILSRILNTLLYMHVDRIFVLLCLLYVYLPGIRFWKGTQYTTHKRRILYKHG